MLEPDRRLNGDDETTDLHLSDRRGIFACDDVQKIVIAVGAEVRREREAQGLSCQELATRWGDTRLALSRLEHGQRELGLRQLVEICGVLAERPSTLMEAAEERTTGSHSRWTTARPPISTTDHSRGPRPVRGVGNRLIPGHPGPDVPHDSGILAPEEVRAILIAVGTQLRRERKAHGANHQQMARWTGLNPSILSRLELNRRDPSLRQFVRLCGVLAERPSHLMRTAEDQALPLPPWHWTTVQPDTLPLTP